MKFTYYLRGAVAMLVLVSTMPSCSNDNPLTQLKSAPKWILFLMPLAFYSQQT